MMWEGGYVMCEGGYFMCDGEKWPYDGGYVMCDGVYVMCGPMREDMWCVRVYMLCVAL